MAAARTVIPLDSYTPGNFNQLDVTDQDLGTTALAMLPAPQGSNVRHLALQSGKDGLLRLLDLDNLSGQGGPGPHRRRGGAGDPAPAGGWGVYPAGGVGQPGRPQHVGVHRQRQRHFWSKS